MADEAKLIAVVEANTAQIERAMKRLVPIIKGSTDQMTASVKKLDSGFASVGKRLDSVGKSLAGFVSVGAIQQVIKETIAWGDALGDLADQTGLTTKQIQVLRYAAKQTGSSAEQMDAALKKFGVTLGQARTKGNDLKKILDANGISLTDMAGKARPAGDILNDVIDLIGRMGDEQQKAAVINAAFGKGFSELITTVGKGLGPIEAWGKALGDTGIVSDDTISKLGELDNKFNDVMTHMQAVAANVVANMKLDVLLDYISRSVDELADLINILNMLQAGDVAGAVKAATTRGERRTTPREAAARDNANEMAKTEREIAAVKADLDKLFARLQQLQQMGKTGAGGAATVAGPIAEISAAIEADSKKLKELMEKRERQRKEAVKISTPEPAPAPVTTGKPAVIPPLGGGGGGGGGKGGKSAAEIAAELIAKEEGYRSKAYWDVNAYRIGFGSSTMTSGGGGIANVAKGSTTTVGDSIRDLNRRITEEFLPKVLAQIGEDAAKKMTPEAIAAMTSVAYNYGRLPGSVVTAAQTGNVASVAGSIERLGANPGRRRREAAIAMGGPGGEVLMAQNAAAVKQSQELADNFEKTQQNAVEAADATLKINDALTNANQAFKRDLVGGFVRDLERGVKPAEAIANALMKIGDRLLDSALNALFPDVGGGILGGIFAGGGVMTSRGPMPLRKYAGGGVAHSPQVAMFGEGGRPEAYVPLPDGRRIPVNIRVPGMGGLGGGRGGQAVAVHNRVTVDPSPMFLVTTHEVARQAGHTAVAEASDGARRRPGGR